MIDAISTLYGRSKVLEGEENGREDLMRLVQVIGIIIIIYYNVRMGRDSGRGRVFHCYKIYIVLQEEAKAGLRSLGGILHGEQSFRISAPDIFEGDQP